MVKEFLDNKPLYYNEIDYTRMPRVYEKVKSHFKNLKTIHIVGTNAKGTTGRFLATALFHQGFKTGHYTSPHILKFNERIWLNGCDIDDGALESAHERLQTILTTEDSNALSYFEYITLLAMLVFYDCDYVVLEAGLGGEFDATAVFAKILTLVTPIDFDHEAFLGNTLEAIATTKLNAMQNNVILGKQKYPEIALIAQDIASKKSARVYAMESLLDIDDIKKIHEIGEKLSLAAYLQENLTLSISALKFLQISYCAKDFSGAQLFGRLTKIAPNITLDVGHNPLAARAIAKVYEGKKIILIYNTYQDKNFQEILQILKPIILHVQIIATKGQRVVAKEILEKTLQDLGIHFSDFIEIDATQSYLIFGSFSVAETFLRGYHE